MDETESPLGLASEVERLLKMPQHLCKQRGICCKVTTFKGLLGASAIQELAQDETPEAEMARDFLTLFIPYDTQGEAHQLAPEFVERVKARAQDKALDPEQVGFFHCRYLLEDGRCGVHEDRPVGCRTYPFPHENTMYHPGCGFEKQGLENWAKIKSILDALGLSSDLTETSDDQPE